MFITPIPAVVIKIALIKVRNATGVMTTEFVFLADMVIYQRKDKLAS